MSAPGAPSEASRAVERTLEEIHLRGDRFMTLALSFHAMLSVFMASAYDTWLVTLTVAPLALSMFLVARRLAPGRFVTRAAAGVALQTFCALHIYQFHGLAEQHFWFFTATTAMIVYKDPRAMWPGVALIIAQHVLFAGLQNSGVQLRFFDVQRVGTVKLVFHFGIALIQAFLATTIARALRNRTVAEARLRAELEEARETAERAVHARSAFLATMSHEIRTPMNGIEGMADAMLAGDLEEDQRECAETIRTSSRALLSIIGDVLDFSKIESGKLDIVDEVYRPDTLAREVTRLLGPKASEYGVSLELAVDEAVPSAVHGDATRVRQVLINLAGNAIKFAPQGHVRLAIGRGGADTLSLVVRDDGIGMDAETLERVFEPFEQASPETAVRFGGTGLGLSITRRLVIAMGGEITLESRPGTGTIARVTLPARAAAPEHARVDGQVQRCVAGTSVLVAEDNPVNRKVAARLLGILGCDVVFAETGREALERLGERRFDLVLMDCQMPEMDGWAATKHWRAEEARRGLEPVPIVALTASTLARDHARCLAAGMQGSLTKPVGLAELCGAIGAHARISAAA